MKKVIQMALFLAIVAGLSGAALSFVYNLTDPIIQEAAIASEKENLVQLYSNGEEFKVVETNFGDYPTLQGVYEVIKGGSVKAHVYKGSVTGYGGASSPIVFLVALEDGKYSGYTVLEASAETSGIGTRIKDAEFKDNIVGTDIGGSVDTLSGATVSSKAVVNSIKEAAKHYQENFK